MKNKFRTLLNNVETIAGGGICALTGWLMLILTLTAFLFTTGMEIVEDGCGVDTTVYRIRDIVESVVYYSDSLVVNVLMLAVFIVGFRLVLAVTPKLRLRHEAAILVVWTAALGVIWVLSSQVRPTYDSARVCEAALGFSQGDYTMMSGDYLREYPYQLGYVQLCELIFRAVALVKGVPDTFLSVQIANAGFLAAGYAGLLWLSALLFPDPRARHLTFSLLLFCAQPIIFCSFTYGIVPGLCFALWAVVFQTLWFRKNKIVYGLLSAPCIGLAILFKSNYLIVLIAMTVVAAVRLLKRKQFVKDIAVILAACVCAFSFSPAVQALYERRSGVTLEPGLPYIAWIAMGLSESQRAPGWYSDVTSNVKFEELGSDAEALSAYSKEVIAERIAYFRENPQYTRDFFYRKFVSQFNETSYQSIWNNNVRDQYEEKRQPAAWVCGNGEAAVKRYMDAFAQAVFVGLMIALFLMMRRRDYTALVLPLSVLGGMLFHLLAEGKSQYILPYFVLMIPAAAWGMTVCCDGFDRLTDRLWPDKQKSGEPTEEETT